MANSYQPQNCGLRVQLPNHHWHRHSFLSLSNAVQKVSILACSALILFPETSFPFPSSSIRKQRFSSRMTNLATGLTQAFSISGPTQSLKNRIFLPTRDLSSVTTGSKDYISDVGIPSDWPIRLIRSAHLTQFSGQNLILETKDMILWLFIIWFFFMGLLKATLIMTSFFFACNSLRVITC